MGQRRRCIFVLVCVNLLSLDFGTAGIDSLDLNAIADADWKYPSCEVGGIHGSCVFSLACSFSGGKHLGVCKNKFLFLSCCQLHKDHQRPIFQPVVAEEEEEEGYQGCGTPAITSRRWRSPASASAEAPLSLPPPRHSRIVGGETSTFGAWPWQVALLQRYPTGVTRHRCGAVLLNKKWVATAAHCVDGYFPHELVLRFGDHDRLLDAERPPSIDRAVASVVMHPNFDFITYEHDLALLSVKGDDLEFSRTVRPVCLPTVDAVTDIGYVTGWGTTTQGGSKPQKLREVSVTIVDHERCNQLFAKEGQNEGLTNIFICAGDEQTGGKDACEGDSGGPLVVRSSAGRWHLAGIVSWGDGCGQVNKLGVYTNVMKFTKWIEKIISSEEDGGKDSPHLPSSSLPRQGSQQSLAEWVLAHFFTTKDRGRPTRN